MNRWTIGIGELGRLGAVAACVTLLPALASAQNVVSEDFTGTTINNAWTAINGACLTAGTASNASIPSCVGLSYYIDNGDRYQIGGQNGYLGNSSAPSSNSAQTPDAVGNGALRLTNGSPYYHESGAIVSTVPFDATAGVQVTFKTITYKGDSGGSGGDGADGISFFLLDASKYTSGSGLLGSWGGSLGYTCSNVNPPYTGQVGAYVGLGIDEYGNFLNGGTNGSGGYNDNTATGVAASGWGSGNYQWNRIGLRGAGTVAWSWLNAHYSNYYPSSLSSSQQSSAVQKTCQTGTLWNYSSNANNPTNTGTSVLDYAPIPGGSAVLSESLTIANEGASKRSQATPIYYVLKINSSGQLSLSYSYNGGSLTQVLSNQSITASNGSLPSSLLFGFAGSNGGSDNVHEIMCFQAAPADQSDSSTTVNLPQDKLVTTAQVYLPSYHTSNWWGQLTAQTLSVTGTYSLTISPTVNWDASCVLTGGACSSMGGTAVSGEGASSRTILSWNGSNGVSFEWSSLSSAEQAALDPGVSSTGTSERLLYLRGDRSNEEPATGPTGTQIYRDRTSVLGDIIHSSPFWVGPPASPNYELTWTDNLYPSAGALENAAPYQSFYNTYSGRENVVYIGANDGLLHGFRSGSMSNGSMVTTTYANDGYEVLAYMPGAVAQAIHSTSTAYDYSSPNYSHAYSVDAPPRARDLFYSGAWHTWLVGGLGAGGSAIYALDVTDPTQFSEANAATLVKGEWTPSTLTCANTTNCGLNLGNTYGTPVIARFHAATGGSDTWGMVFGNGFPNAITASMASASSSITGTIGNAITASIGAQFTGSISYTTLTVTAGSILTVGQTVSGPSIRNGTTVTAITGGSCSANPCTYTVNNSQTISSEQMYTSSTNMYVTNGSGIGVGQTVSGSGVASGTTIVSQVSGTTGGVGTYTVSVAQTLGSTQMLLPGTTLTITAGTGMAVGSTITGTGVAAGTTVTALGTGTGGLGTYTVSVSQAVLSESMSNGVATMTVTAGSGLAVGQTIWGSGVSSGTKITAFGSGTGGLGSYIINNSQTLASTQLTTGSSTGTAGIYVMLVNPSSGAKTFYYLDTGYGPTQDPLTQGRANGIAYTTPADFDGDNTVDYVYAGDLFGNIWRFDLTSSNPASWSASTFGGSGARPLFSSPTSTVNGVAVGQPFTSKLMVWGAPIGGGSGVIIIGGTGQEVPLTPVSAVSYAPGSQAVYGIWDWDMSNWNSLSHMSLASVTESTYATALGGAINSSSLTTQTLTQSGTFETDTNNAVCWYGSTACGTGNTKFGWQITLPGTDEQVIYNPTIAEGNLQINTTIPSTSTIFSCTAQLPTGWTMMINPTTGGGFSSSAFLDSSGNPETVNGSPVAGQLTNGTGSVTNITGAGSSSTIPNTAPPSGGNNPCSSGFSSVASLSNQGFWVTDTSNGTATGGATQSHSTMCGHRVTWTELR